MQASEPVPADVLARRLGTLCALSELDVERVRATVRVATRALEARRDLFREGDRPGGVNLILSGWACRYKVLADGRKQIVAVLVPGDMCDLNNALLGRMDHSIEALTPLRYAELPHALVDRLLETPTISKALWRQMLIGISVQREWTLNIGRRNAIERVGHFICELYFRLHAMGLATEGRFDLPLSQSDLGDAMGLSAVHVNRTLQQLRASQSVSLRGRAVAIHDYQALAEIASFTPDYLHLDVAEEAPVASLSGAR